MPESVNPAEPKLLKAVYSLKDGRLIPQPDQDTGPKNWSMAVYALENGELIRQPEKDMGPYTFTEGFFKQLEIISSNDEMGIRQGGFPPPEGYGTAWATYFPTWTRIHVQHERSS